MVIGIDASRAFGPFWGGPEAYSYYLIQHILRLDSQHLFRLYLPPNASKNSRYKSFFSNLVSPSSPVILSPSPVILSEAKDLNSSDSSGRTPLLAQASQNDERGKMTSQYELKIINWKRLWTQVGLAFECLKNPPDVLFVPAHTLPVIRRPGLKTVVTVHDLGAQFLPNYHKFPQKYYLNLMTDYAVKNATKIISVSEYTRKDILQKFQISNFKFQIDRKISTVYEGYDRETFYPRPKEEIDSVRKKFGISGDYFLFLGTIQPRKNLARLIEAFSRLLSARPRLANPQGVALESLSLILAGSPGWLNGEIYAAPKKFGVQDRVKFVGKVGEAELPALMSGAAAFVFPSLFEGFGLSPLESMACGVPVILSNSTSLPEVGGEAAFYVDPNSSYDIADKMRLVLSMSESDRKAMVEKGLSQAAKFSWEKAAQETLKALESATSI